MMKLVRHLMIWLLILSPGVHAEGLRLSGVYDYADQNPKTGQPYPAQRGTFAFVVLLDKVSYRISVTNLSNGSLWSELAFDGTNNISFVPYAAPFVSASNPRSNAVLATVSPSPTPLSAVYDRVFIWVPWIVYGFDPSRAPLLKSGLRPIPLPWCSPRYKPGAYGWDWKLAQSPKSRFVEWCNVVRDSRLDLKGERKELLRVELDYPEDIEINNDYLLNLAHRHATPSGFRTMEYQCSEWTTLNGVQLPARSDISIWTYPYKAFPATQFSLHLQSATPMETSFDALPDTVSPTEVIDYRYKAVRRGRIHKYAEYTLNPGEKWKSHNDPVLLERAEHQLRVGPKYNLYDYRPNHPLAWVLVAGILILPLAIKYLFNRKRMRKINQ